MTTPETERHAAIWRALDQIAAAHDLSRSGLAKIASLDPTSFNPSKRVRTDGRLRWPSTETIHAVLTATGETWTGFGNLVERAKP